MENNVQVFNNEEFGQVRTTMVEGEPWFVAMDVCKALEIDATATRRLDDDEKAPLRLTQTSLNGTIQDREVTIINEPGLYSLVLGSRKPEAKKFKRWITHDVIPSIRKYGIYATEDLTDKAINDPDWMIELLTNYKREREERKRIESESNNRLAQIQEMQPKVDYCDQILSCPDAIPISVIAKDYGKTAQWFNKKLDELGIQHKIGGTWLLNKPYADKGYTKTQTFTYKDEFEENRVNVLTKWTQKGRMFLYEALRDANILPLCETEYSV